MSTHFAFRPIGFVESIYKEKFATPRQANLVTSVRSCVRLEPPYDDEEALLGLDRCSHIWLHFLFNQNRDNAWRPRVRPPRCGGNNTLGVFATRSPYRPNALGMSAVKFAGVRKERDRVYVDFLGGDMVNGTPVIDIKPYVPYADCLPDAVNQIAENAPQQYPVDFSDLAAEQCAAAGDQTVKSTISDILAQDPRPQYHKLDDQRIYGAQLGTWQVRWSVAPDARYGMRVCVEEVLLAPK